MLKHLFILVPLIFLIAFLRYTIPAAQTRKHTTEILPATYALHKLDDHYESIKDTLAFGFQYPQIEKFVFTPQIQATTEGNIVRNNLSYISYYKDYLSNPDIQIRNLGNFALGIYFSTADSSSLALQYLNKVRDTTKLLSFWKGRSLALAGNQKKARPLLELSLISGVYVDSCKKFLLIASMRAGDFKTANQLLKKFPEMKNTLSENEVLKIEKANIPAWKYFFFQLAGKCSNLSFYGSLFIALVWLCLLLRLNIFDVQVFPMILVILFLSVLSAIFITDFLYNTYGLMFSEFSPGRLFIFSVLNIGIVEELVKAIPFLLAVLIFKPKDPVTLLLMAGSSGIAFSFTENILYIERYGYNILAARGFSPTIVHIVLSSFFAFAIAFFHYWKKKSMVLLFVLAWLLSALFHGLYDYFLFLEEQYRMEDISGISMMLVLLLVFIYGMILANLLNTSPAFSYEKSLRLEKRAIEFIAGLFAIEVFEYATVLYYAGIDRGDLWLIVNSLKIFFAVFILSYAITRKDLIKNNFSLLHLHPFYNNTAINAVFFLSGKLIIDRQNYPLGAEERFADIHFNTACVRIANTGFFSATVKEPVLKFKKFHLRQYASGIPAELGYMDDSGKFIKLKSAKIIRQ